MTFFRKFAAAIALVATTSLAQATVALDFNTAGYEVFTFHVAAEETGSFGLVPGPTGAAIGLFDSAGKLIVFAEHAINSNEAVIAHRLAAGDYSVLVSTCCNFQYGMLGPDSHMTTWDNQTNGLFYYSASATLAGIESALDAHPMPPKGTYTFYTNETLQQVTVPAPLPVPEPGSLALFGICFGALGVASRRTQPAGTMIG